MQKAGSFIATNLWQNIYIICLLLIIIIHFVAVELLEFMRNEDGKDTLHVSSSEYVTMASLLFLEWFLIIYQCKVLKKYIFLTDIKPIFCLYLSKILAFTDIYLLMFKMHPTEFDHPNNILVNTSSYRDIGYILLNYSVSIQTLTGISSVAPRKVASEVFSALQVIFFGIGYSVFILSIAVLRFAQTDILPQNIQNNNENNKNQNIFNFPNVTSPRFDASDNIKQQKEEQNSLLLVNTKPSINDSDNLSSINKSISHLLTTPKVKFIQNYVKFAKFFYRYMMLILICIQIPRLVLMYFLCHLQCHNNATLTIGIILDSLLLFLCIVSGIIRIRLIKTLGIHLNISFFGLIRSYLTVMVAFGILYFDIWIWTKNGKNTAFNVMNYDDTDINSYWSMLVHFLYFSTSTFTNVGAESAISTKNSLGQFLNSAQMIMAVIFDTVVFGVSLLDISSHRITDTEKFVESHILSPNEDMIETNRLREVGLIQRNIRQIVAAQQTPREHNGYSHPAINSLSINHDVDHHNN